MIVVKNPYQLENVFRLPAEEPREVGLFVADRPEQFVLVTAVEGRLADQHLVEQHAEGPPVHAVRVVEAFDDL